MTTTDLTLGSLCTGVGGLDLGVQAALGGRIAWHAETDPHARQVLTRHWPDVPNHGDLRTTDWQDVEPIDILTAGFPCQGLSVAGRRAGLTEHSPSGLWPHIVTAIAALRPHLVVIENVRGLLSTRAGTDPVRDVEPCPSCLGDPPHLPGMRALGAVLASLAEIGYDCRWTCLRASDVGAPHRRERAFLTAYPAPRPPAAEDTDGEPRPQRRLPASCETQGRRPRPHPGRRDRTPPAHTPGQRRHQGLPEPASPQRHPHPLLHRGRPHHRGPRPSAAHADLLGRQGRCRYEPEPPGRHEPPHGRHSPPGWWGRYLPAIRYWEHITGHAAPPPTQPGTRSLSADFVEWMMGLPCGWVTQTTPLSRAARLRLLGNSVVPLQAADAIGQLLADGIPADGRLQRPDTPQRDER